MSVNGTTHHEIRCVQYCDGLHSTRRASNINSARLGWLIVGSCAILREESVIVIVVKIIYDIINNGMRVESQRVNQM